MKNLVVRSTAWILGVFTILLGVFLLGPRIETEERIRPVQIPDHVDQYLSTSESEFEDLTPGVAKNVIWRHESGKRTSLALVYVHGFSASRQELAPLCDSLAEVLDANLYYTRLAGHGRGGDALAGATLSDWLTDMVEAAEIGRAIGDQLVLIGNSTGSTLVTWFLASQPSDDVVSAILLSPNFGPKDKRSQILLWPWGIQIAEAFIGKTRSWEPHNEKQGRFWTTTYPTKALLPMMALVELTNRQNLVNIDAPILVLYSPVDTVVDITMVKENFGRLGSTKKRLVAMKSEDPSGHILAGRIMSPGTTDRVKSQIESFLARAFADSSWMIAGVTGGLEAVAQRP